MGDTGLVGQGEVFGPLRVIDEEEDAVHADFLVRDAPVAICANPSGLAGKVGVDGLEGSWKGIIDGEVSQLTVRHADGEGHLDEVSDFGLGERCGGAIGFDTFVATDDREAFLRDRLQWRHLGFGGEGPVHVGRGIGGGLKLEVPIDRELDGVRRLALRNGRLNRVIAGFDGEVNVLHRDFVGLGVGTHREERPGVVPGRAPVSASVATCEEFGEGGFAFG